MVQKIWCKQHGASNLILVNWCKQHGLVQAASTAQAIHAFISISKLSPTFTRFGH